MLTDGQYRVIRAKNVNNYNGGNNGHTQRAQSVKIFCLALLFNSALRFGPDSVRLSKNAAYCKTYVRMLDVGSILFFKHYKRAMCADSCFSNWFYN